MSVPVDILKVAWPAAVAAAAAGSVLAVGTFGPRSNFWGPVISRGVGASGVALTFDDGPTPDGTDRVLDTLGELGVRAAFFVIGRSARQHPRLVERMHAEGHVVGNHSQDHSHFGMFGRRTYWRKQLEMTDEAIRQAIGRRPALFRPPMGQKTGHVTRAAAMSGHTIVTWTRSAYDGVGASPQRIVRRLTVPARAGDILLLHDGLEPNAIRRDPSPTVAAVRPLVERLRSVGLEPQPLDEILGLAPYRESAQLTSAGSA
jgi:peptidoglycan-N-acetylglucosamine deacetylase